MIFCQYILTLKQNKDTPLSEQCQALFAYGKAYKHRWCCKTRVKTQNCA